LFRLAGAQEKDAIEGHKYLDAPDSLELQALVKSGNEFKIHPDQIRQWTNSGGTITSQFFEKMQT